jgi:EmrB/QacA subfamily drug resistance transporter
MAKAQNSPAVAEGADPRRWLALAVITIAQLMVVLDSSIVNIALPTLETELSISEANRQWVVTAYLLTFGGFLLLGGRIADYVGRKKIFLFGLGGFALASAIGGAANNLEVLLAARALQGLFAALMAPAALSIISLTFTEPAERAKAFGVYGGASGGGAAIGLILGGVLTEYASWRWCFLVNVPIALGAALAAARVVSESRASGNARYDVPGAITATAGLTSLVYGFSMAAEDGWGASSTISFIAVGVALLVAFVMIEKRSTHPLLPLRVVLHRDRGGSFLGSAFAISGMMGMFLLMTFYFQGTLGYSALKSGFAFLPFSVGIITAAMLSGRFLPKYGPRPLIFGGFLAATLGMLWTAQIDAGSSYIVQILPAQVVMSMGMGFAFVALSSTALTGVSEHDAGVASAALNATQQVGGSVGTALLNTVATSATANYIASHGTSAPELLNAQVHGYASGFEIAAVFLGVAALLGALLIRSVNKPGSATDEVSSPQLVHVG